MRRNGKMKNQKYNLTRAKMTLYTTINLILYYTRNIISHHPQVV